MKTDIFSELKTANEVLEKSNFCKLIHFNSEEETYVIEPSLNNLQLKLVYFIVNEIQERLGLLWTKDLVYELEIPNALQMLLAPLDDFGFTLRFNDYLFDVWTDICNGIRVTYSTWYDETTDVFGEILNIADIFNYLDKDDLSEIGELTW